MSLTLKEFINNILVGEVKRINEDESGKIEGVTYYDNELELEFNLEADYIKRNLYRESNPNMYLASFAKFMFDFKEEDYIKKIIKKGFQRFFKYKILPFNKTKETPIYFIGSIAHYFRDILEKTAKNNNLKITDVIQRPIDSLLEYHKNNIN